MTQTFKHAHSNQMSDSTDSVQQRTWSAPSPRSDAQLLAIRIVDGQALPAAVVQLAPFDLVLDGELLVGLELASRVRLDDGHVIIVHDGARDAQPVLDHPRHALDSRDVEVDIAVDDQRRLHLLLGLERGRE